MEAKTQAIAEELTKFLNAEPVSQYICRICCSVRDDECMFVDSTPTVSVSVIMTLH